MMDLPSRGVVANAAVLSWGADLKEMSGIARDAQRDGVSGYEPEELLARRGKVQRGFSFATLEAAEYTPDLALGAAQRLRPPVTSHVLPINFHSSRP
jgi:hypothetical protein